MKAWRFSTDQHPAGDRRQAWREAMRRLRLPLGSPSEAAEADASVISLVSPMGMEFSLVSAGAQEISGRNPDQPAAIWLAALLQGAAVLDDGRDETPVVVGDIVFGPTGVAATLQLTTRFRLLLITAPRIALDHRLIAPRAVRVGCLPADRGVNHAFSGLLRATAEAIEELSDDQLRPIELAVTEFLVACLASETPPPRGAAAARAAQLHRVRQTIETLLAEPDLTLRRAAEAEGVSPRYLQRLFSDAGESFTGYVRLRRLERCRLDLLSPRYGPTSISTICFRWGFNGSAHFSRSFRRQYGMSPREYRRAGAERS
ncbi:MAG: transcriptional regulator, AraC family [Caulobacteraceae bacterium]|nr:transcriptional regulator, AraC family [Caulobacteraceae bacterium]